MTISKCQLDMQIKLERCEFIADEADVSLKVALIITCTLHQWKRACSNDEQKRRQRASAAKW